MNPFGLDATALMLWGLVAHLIADWLLQNDWMANNKANLRHPAGYVHAGIHGALLALVFGWVALPLAVAHLLIDTRKPVAWWSLLIRQTQPGPVAFVRRVNKMPSTRRRVPERVDKRVYERPAAELHAEPPGCVVVDIGMFVRFWNDQVWHIACLALAALVVA